MLKVKLLHVVVMIANDLISILHVVCLLVVIVKFNDRIVISHEKSQDTSIVRDTHYLNLF